MDWRNTPDLRSMEERTGASLYTSVAHLQASARTNALLFTIHQCGTHRHAVHQHGTPAGKRMHKHAVHDLGTHKYAVHQRSTPAGKRAHKHACWLRLCTGAWRRTCPGTPAAMPKRMCAMLAGCA